uniref:Beta-defensin-like domain-containing protein n=1 Tax=Cyanoderma ruficeps TaxID=181631 RepID=A0A8C3XEI9_9PASS
MFRKLTSTSVFHSSCTKTFLGMLWGPMSSSGNSEELRVLGLGLPRDTLRCLDYHGYCFHRKSCPEPFAAFGTCYRRRRTCCVDTTSNFHVCLDEGGHCVSPEIRCLQEQEGLCPRRGWKCCSEL